MNVRDLAIVIVASVLLGTLYFADSSLAEEVEGQEKNIGLYLFSEDGVGKLHTRDDGGYGDQESITIPGGSSVSFALNYSLQDDLSVNSYNSPDVGFHAYLYANCGLTGQGHLNVYVRDGTTMTGGELLAMGDENVGSSFTNAKLLVRVDIYWEDDYGPNYQFDSEHFIVLELENDEENAITLFFDTEEESDDETRLIVKANPVKDISAVTEAYDLETSNLEDLMPTDNFQPNLPVDFSKVFISAQALNVFGTYDIVEFKVVVFDSDDNELFIENSDIEEPEDNSGTNDFEEITWNYNDPVEPSENHNGKGIYTVRVAAIDQQGNEFFIDKAIQMDAYGIYSSTPQTQQSVAVGGDVTYQIHVRNSGDENDKFTIEPSSTNPEEWEVSPQTWTSNSLLPGEEQSVTFTVSAADSTDMVGKNTIIVFTGRSENSVTPVNFDLNTKTSVGANYEISMYFDDPSSGQAVTSFSTTGVAGDWNQYQLSIANQGQDTDSVQLISQEVPADWEIKFDYGDLNDATITVADIPRLGDGYNVVNVTVWAKPAQGGDVDTAYIKLIGISQGNTTKSDTATLILTRSFGLSLFVVGQDSSGIFQDKIAGQQFEIDLLLESAVEGDHTIRLYMGDNFPDGWSHSFKENGATVTEVSISGGDSKPLDLFITVGSQAVFKEDGDVFDAYAQDISDSSVVAKKQLTVILAYSGGFELSSLKYRETLAPGDSYTFQLTIENKANANDKFTISAVSVPSGWRVLFLIEGNTVDVEAGRTKSVEIKIEVSDEARDGDQESITISIFSDISNQEKQKSFVIDVEQGFTARLTTAISDLWYIFVFFALIIVVGAISYNQQDGEDWDDDEEYESPSNPPSPEVPNTTDSSSDDDWDDWD